MAERSRSGIGRWGSTESTTRHSVPSGRPRGLMKVGSGFSEAVMSQGLQILPWFDRRLESFPISLYVFEQLPITLDAKFALNLQTFFVSNSSSLLGCVTETFRTSWYEVQAGRCSPWQGCDRLLGSVNYYFPEE